MLSYLLYVTGIAVVFVALYALLLKQHDPSGHLAHLTFAVWLVATGLVIPIAIVSLVRSAFSRQ